MKTIFIHRLILFVFSTIATVGLAQPGDPGGDPDCPTLFTVGGGGNYCAGGAGVSISLGGSNSGVIYQLKNGSTDVGSPVMGGNPTGLIWNNITAAGTYTIEATNTVFPCTVTMNGSAVVTVNALPTLYTVNGGGSACTGATGPTITLNSSQSGVTYQLKMGAANVGSPKNGTGSALSWTNNTVTGTYTVVATNTTTSCAQTMTGSATVTIGPTLFVVSGTATICASAAAPAITLSGSQTGVNYQLKRGSTLIGSPVAGTGATITWPNITTTGTYLVSGTNTATGCVATMSGSAIITINALPTGYTVSGTGNFCAGSTGRTITLSGSQTGVNYQLLVGAVNSGPAVNGTGSAINWPNTAIAGTYTVRATNATTNCIRTMTGNAVLTLVPIPTAYTVGGGGVLCSGAAGLAVTLSSSQTGVSYQLKNGATNVGTPKTGTGAALNWTSNVTAGTYTITAAATANGACAAAMTGSATVVVNLLPTLFTVSGTATICASAAAPAITLNGSQTGINYQLKRGSTLIGSPVAGTGATITWPNITTTGTYLVSGTNTATGCVATMSGSAIITINALPTGYSVNGNATSYCVGGAGVSVTLSNSQTGVNYQLKLGGVNTGVPRAGTATLLTWPNITVAGTYTIVATNATTGCVRAMTGSRVITINPLPALFNVTGGTLCTGSAITVGLSGSQSGVNYQLKLNGTNQGAVKAGTGGALSWPGQSGIGAYTVLATRASTLCTQTMTGSAILSSIPTAFNVGGGGEFCSGAGIVITLSGSQVGVNYQLMQGSTDIGIPIPGTGLALSWPPYSAEGQYTARAINALSGCSQAMNSSATITINITCAALDNFSFQYQYDERKRMTHKKVPGAEWEYLVYDNRNRLVMSQDGEQRKNKQWEFTRYDALNRPIMTGMYTHDIVLDQQQMSQMISNSVFYETSNSDASTHLYTHNMFAAPAFIEANFEAFSVTYYDNYDFQSGWGSNYDYHPGDVDDQAVNDVVYSQPDLQFDRVKEQVTGKKTMNLSDHSFLLSVNYYDDRLRLVQSINGNHKQGVDRLTSVYDFTGKVLASKTTHSISEGSPQTVLRTFDYDHGGRLINTWHTVNSQAPVLLAHNEYNELGLLVDKKLHSTDPLASDAKQSIDYRYNIRGWLTSINNSQLESNATNDDTNDLFGMELGYNQALSGLENTHLFNGNISAIKWSENMGLGTPALGLPKERAYVYTYDNLNRLTAASHHEKIDLWAPTASFAEDNIQYDLNGNIKNLNRKGKGEDAIDALEYVYGEGGSASNKLKKVIDHENDSKGFSDGTNTDDDYAYDANGNLTIDRNKSITSITYNHLNLPVVVTKNSGENIKFVYRADGVKLRQEVYNASNALQKSTDYVGEFMYENNALQLINHEEGRVVMTGAQPEYQYHHKDHLGNVRLTFTTKEDVQDETATMETASEATEHGQFLNYDEAIKINYPMFDHTDEGTTFYSTRLTGTPSEREGLAKSLSVMPGDRIEARVFAKYLDPDQDNLDVALRNFILSIAPGGSAATGTTIIDGGIAGSLGNQPFPYPGVLVRENDEGDGPKAYLNYLVFNRNYDPLDGGYVRVTTDAREDGKSGGVEGVNHEQLSFSGDEIIIKEAGYVYIWISNENDTPVEVYFDDFKVTHTKSPVIQTDDYYPFGLTFNSYQRENSTPNDYKYNGKEEQTELGLGWLDYGARMYQPELGRFFAQDRFAEKYFVFSPYQYAANNPVLYIDVNGDSINVAEQHREEFNKTLTGAFGSRSSSFSYSKSGNLLYSGGTKGLNKDQKNLLKGLDKMMGEETVTNIVFGSSTEITMNDGSKQTVNASDGDGAITVLVGENDVSQNTILVDPKSSSQSKNVFTVTNAYYSQPVDPANGPRFQEQNIKNNTTSSVFHELGHVLERGNTQDRVINYENNARRQTGLPVRPYDETHNRTVKKGQYGN